MRLYDLHFQNKKTFKLQMYCLCLSFCQDIKRCTYNNTEKPLLKNFFVLLLSLSINTKYLNENKIKYISRIYKIKVLIPILC